MSGMKLGAIRGQAFNMNDLSKTTNLAINKDRQKAFCENPASAQELTSTQILYSKGNNKAYNAA